MKIRPFFSPIPPPPRACGVLVVCALAFAAACSSDEPTAAEPVLPSGSGVFAGGASAPPGEPGAPAAPAGEPLSAPPAEEQPQATETNFKVRPCLGDADCPQGWRCQRPDAGVVAPGDGAVARADAGPTDASAGPDAAPAEPAPGLCVDPASD